MSNRMVKKNITNTSDFYQLHNSGFNSFTKTIARNHPGDVKNGRGV